MASTSTPDELFLIDGNSLAYRAFFALPESIATSTGVPTNAIFGFASMLVKILTDYGPKSTVVVWDAGSSGRKEVYSEYKAQRSSRPDLLREQWPALEPLADASTLTRRGRSLPGVRGDLPRSAKPETEGDMSPGLLFHGPNSEANDGTRSASEAEVSQFRDALHEVVTDRRVASRLRARAGRSRYGSELTGPRYRSEPTGPAREPR